MVANLRFALVFVVACNAGGSNPEELPTTSPACPDAAPAACPSAKPNAGSPCDPCAQQLECVWPGTVDSDGCHHPGDSSACVSADAGSGTWVFYPGSNLIACNLPDAG